MNETIKTLIEKEKFQEASESLVELIEKENNNTISEKLNLANLYFHYAFCVFSLHSKNTDAHLNAVKTPISLMQKVSEENAKRERKYLLNETKNRTKIIQFDSGEEESESDDESENAKTAWEAFEHTKNLLKSDFNDLTKEESTMHNNLLVQTFYYLALLASEVGKFDFALADLETATKLVEETKDITETKRKLFSLGFSICKLEKKWTKAKSFLQNLIELLKEENTDLNKLEDMKKQMEFLDKKISVSDKSKVLLVGKKIKLN